MNVLAQDCAFEYSQMPDIHASPQELEHPFNKKKHYMPKWHRDILQGKVSQGKFSNWIRCRRGGFLSYLNHQLIKFEEE